MALNYAEVWSPDLLEIMEQESLTSPFVTTAVKWLDAKTFHFTQMSTSGYKSHNRNGGWNKGTFAQEDVPYTVSHDRDIEFLVDKADVDETNQTASIKNISETFHKTQQVPEMDAYFFSKVATEAQKILGIDRTSIRRCCIGEKKDTKGRTDDERLQWLYYEDYLKSTTLSGVSA